jgi:hypothetical protein
VSLRRRQTSEIRDPRGATLGTGWATSPGRPKLLDWDAEVAFRAQTSQWLVGRAVELIADRISSWPFRMGQDPDKPGDYNEKAKLAQLLGPAPGSPNPELSARALWKWSIVNYLVTGRFGWEIERGAARKPPRPTSPIRPGQSVVQIQTPDSSGIVGLWPLVTAILFPIESDPRIPAQRRSYFSGFQLRPYGATQYVEYKRDEVAYGWNPSASDPRQPFSALQSLRLNINILYEMDEYTWAFMANDATPAGMMVHPKIGETPEDRENWRSRIIGNHKGAKNANKLAFTEATVDENGKTVGVIEYIAMGANNRDSQLSVIYDAQLQAVSGGLGVPMSRLDASGRTYNNAEQEDWNWHEDKLLPLARELADIVNRELAPKFDDGLLGWFDLSGVRSLKPRMSEGVNFAAIEGDMLRDERRMFAGLGPVDLKALEAEKEADAKMATPLLLPPPGDSLGRLPASGINPSIGHAGAAKPGIESEASAKSTPVASDAAANASTGNGSPAPAPRTAKRSESGEWRIIPAHEWTGSEDDLEDDAGAPCEVCNVGADRHGMSREDLGLIETEEARHFDPNEPRNPLTGEWGLDSHGAPKKILVHSADGEVKGRISLIEAAEMMHGTNSPKHLAAIKKFGAKPAKRHAGPEGHDHVSSGHHAAGSLADVLVKHREAVAKRYTAMLGQQLGDLDARAVTSTQARAQGKRGQQLLRDGEVRADALYEPAFWTEATRAAVAPVFYAVAASAELALGVVPDSAADLEAWASARASAFAEARVTAQLVRLAAGLRDVERGLDGAADWLRGDGVSSSIIVDVWDDAVRSLQPSAQVETVRDLLTRFAAGQIDLDQARLELETAP